MTKNELLKELHGSFAEAEKQNFMPRSLLVLIRIVEANDLNGFDAACVEIQTELKSAILGVDSLRRKVALISETEREAERELREASMKESET